MFGRQNGPSVYCVVSTNQIKESYVVIVLLLKLVETRAKHLFHGEKPSVPLFTCFGETFAQREVSHSFKISKSSQK